jgi:hypothetical protein
VFGLTTGGSKGSNDLKSRMDPSAIVGRLKFVRSSVREPVSSTLEPRFIHPLNKYTDKWASYCENPSFHTIGFPVVCGVLVSEMEGHYTIDRLNTRMRLVGWPLPGVLRCNRRKCMFLGHV